MFHFEKVKFNFWVRFQSFWFWIMTKWPRPHRSIKFFFKFFAFQNSKSIFVKQKINRDFPIKTCGHSSFDKPLFAALRHLILKKFVFFYDKLNEGMTKWLRPHRSIKFFSSFLRSRTRNYFLFAGESFCRIFRPGKKQKINRDFPIKTLCGHCSSTNLFLLLCVIWISRNLFLWPPQNFIIFKASKTKKTWKKLKWTMWSQSLCHSDIEKKK
jgi:hypothetical protein